MARWKAFQEDAGPLVDTVTKISHPMDTSDDLDASMDLHINNTRGIVWAHNTHVGDARFKDMALEGMVNIGQLACEREGEDKVALVGSGTHHGTVIAGQSKFYLPLRDQRENEQIAAERVHRAIGLVYNPAFERYGNYVPTRLSRRYDAFMFIDETQAVHPLHMQPKEEPKSVPETYPWGL